MDILTEARAEKNLTMDRIGEIWYRTKDWQPHAHQHYDDSRYHALNLHAMFSKGTVEFRLFNSTLHAGEIKAYVNLCLANSSAVALSPAWKCIPLISSIRPAAVLEK